MDYLKQLEDLATKATPGPWHSPGIGEVHSQDHRVIVEAQFAANDPECLCGTQEDADYIAALSPERVLALVACVRAAEERVRLRKAVRAHTLGEGPLPHHDEIFAADDALDSALSALQHKERL